MLAAVAVLGVPVQGGRRPADRRHHVPGRVRQGGQPRARALHAEGTTGGVPGQQGVGAVGEPEAAPAARRRTAQLLQCLEEPLGVEGAVVVPDERGDPGPVRLLRQQCAGRVLGRRRRFHVEAREREGFQLPESTDT